MEKMPNRHINKRWRDDKPAKPGAKLAAKRWKYQVRIGGRTKIISLYPAEFRFCEMLLQLGNEKAAYRAAYEDGKRLSDDYVEMRCVNILNRPRVQKAIELLKEAREKNRYLNEKPRFNRELLSICFHNACDIFDPETKQLRHPTDWPEELQRAIKSFDFEVIPETGEVVVSKARFHDKLKGLDMFAKHVGFYAEHNAQKNEGDQGYGTAGELTEAIQDLIDTVKKASGLEAKTIDVAEQAGTGSKQDDPDDGPAVGSGQQAEIPLSFDLDDDGACAEHVQGMRRACTDHAQGAPEACAEHVQDLSSHKSQQVNKISKLVALAAGKVARP